MASSYSYDRLPPLQETPLQDESQDIADITYDSYNSQWTLHPLSTSSSSPPNYTSADPRGCGDGSSLKSFETCASSSSSSSSSHLEKLKIGWNRIRRKPLPRYMQGSIRRHPAADIHPTRISRGVWKDQLLVDRSLRGMAALTTAFAVAMIIVIATNLKPFHNRLNKFTSSVGGQTRDCTSVTHTNTALLLVINVAATMILGMSNTYQQLVTSLTIDDLKHMLQKFGDSRVGTNSPFNINHKREGKIKSWSAWFLLICTSLPIHFLANSLIGPSYILEPPISIEFNETTFKGLTGTYSYGGSDYISNPGSFVCWSAFRTGQAHFPVSLMVLGEDDSTSYSSEISEFNRQHSRMIVNYDKRNCTGLAKTATDVRALEASWTYNLYYDRIVYRDGHCIMGSSVTCTLLDSKPTLCRLNVRMNAAFILAAGLSVKAIYMISVNLLARGKLKRQCLTFGDVLVASASNPELRVQGECLVNAGDSYRRTTSHTCHPKHCKSKEESKTGDEIGHCQKCKKWNKICKLSSQPQPTMATKFKKSLISNLGNTALTQMCLLMFCSLCMLMVSIFIAVATGSEYTAGKQKCDEYSERGYNEWCNMSSTAQFNQVSGGWGGFNQSLTVASLLPDRLGNEIISFCISNGAQFIYSLLYLMLIYNITLISQEYDWGKLEWERRRLRCTIVKGDCFSQDYLLQLPKQILFPIMGYSVLTHWMLGEALQTQEAIWREDIPGRHVEHSKYIITYAAYPLWAATFLILVMTATCWWAFTYKREGFIPQMFGSIRTLCAATTQLDDFPNVGVKWGDLGMGKQFRHAGLSSEDVMKIIPHELYAGIDPSAGLAETEDELFMQKHDGDRELDGSV